MKSVVMVVSDYARAPSSESVTLDLPPVLQEEQGVYEMHHIPITLHLDATATMVKGDATRLRQGVHNLLQNAQDALQGIDGPEIVLGSTSKEGILQLWVQDNGSGISESLLARAFEPYMTTKPRGTGLGLAIVKKIVEEHGGNIKIENVAAGGTRVSFNLPLSTEAG